MTTDALEPKPNPAWKIALVAAPLFLLLSTAGAMWFWWKRSQDAEPDPRLALAASAVRTEEIDDHLWKLAVLIGPRDWETPAGRRNMRRAIALIEGTLSPQNYGFVVERGEYLELEEERWPTIWVDLKGGEDEKNVVIVCAPYDARDSQVAAVLGAANDLRDEKMRKTVRFVFFPEQLYSKGEGKVVTDLLSKEESRVEVLIPQPPQSGPALTAAEVVPIAQDLVEKVRNSAR